MSALIITNLSRMTAAMQCYYKQKICHLIFSTCFYFFLSISYSLVILEIQTDIQSQSTLCSRQFMSRISYNSLQMQHICKNQNDKIGYGKCYIDRKENKIGQYQIISSDYEQGEPFLTLGPNYIFFLTSFLIVNLASILVIFKIKNQERFKPFYCVSIIILSYLDVVWLASALINPGIATNTVLTNEDLCLECFSKGRQIVRAVNRFHCKDCQICIDQQILHFRLVGACIGKNNLIVFKFLLMGLFLWVLSAIMIIPQTFHMI